MRHRLSGRSTWYVKNLQSRVAWHIAWQASADNAPSAKPAEPQPPRSLVTPGQRAANSWLRSMSSLRLAEQAKILVAEAADRMLYAKALAYIYDDVQMPPPTRDDCREAINILTDVLGRARRVLGPSHPVTTRAEDWLQTTRLVVRGLEFRWLVQES